MIALIQRVSQAEVRVQDRITGAIDRGVLAFIGVQREDTESDADRLLQRVLTYRIFADDQGRMNLDLRAVAGGLLLVSQFTLAADTRTGTRAGFTTAAAPDRARQLFEHLRGPRPGRASAGRDRGIRRGHAGQPRERRPRDLLAGNRQSRCDGRKSLNLTEKFTAPGSPFALSFRLCSKYS